MKYSEAEKQIKALSNKYDISIQGGDFDVAYNGRAHVIYVSGDYKYHIYVGYPEMFSAIPSSNKVYMIMAKLAMTPPDERVEDKKYYVHVFKDQNGYLNIIDSNIKFYDKIEANGFKTKFTRTEVEQLKQREDIPLNWGKVKLEPAK